MDLKEASLETVATVATILSTAMIAYAGVKLATFFFGPIDINLKD